MVSVIVAFTFGRSFISLVIFAAPLARISQAVFVAPLARLGSETSNKPTKNSETRLVVSALILARRSLKTRSRSMRGFTVTEPIPRFVHRRAGIGEEGQRVCLATLFWPPIKGEVSVLGLFKHHL